MIKRVEATTEGEIAVVDAIIADIIEWRDIFSKDIALAQEGLAGDSYTSSVARNEAKLWAVEKCLEGCDKMKKQGLLVSV